MLDYIVLKSLKMSLSDARRQAKNGGIADGIIVAEARNIPVKGINAAPSDVLTIEELVSWGDSDDKKIKFVRNFTHDNHDKTLQGKPITGVGWGTAEIAYERINLTYDHEPYGFSIAFGVLSDTSDNGEALLRHILASLDEYKPVIQQ